jgi:hypothetical protein
MPEPNTLLLAACLFASAQLYTSVSHAEAAYIGLTTLFGDRHRPRRDAFHGAGSNILVASLAVGRRICTI